MFICTSAYIYMCVCVCVCVCVHSCHRAATPLRSPVLLVSGAQNQPLPPAADHHTILSIKVDQPFDTHTHTHTHTVQRALGTWRNSTRLQPNTHTHRDTHTQRHTHTDTHTDTHTH